MQPGEIIHSRYRLLRLIGNGASGAVWAARNELINRDVALKILDPEVMSNKVLLRRFFNEAKTIGGVNHPSIVDIFDLGQAEDGSPFLVLELLDGEPLDVRIRRGGALNPEMLLDVCAGVAKALHLAHQQGIVHRDLKPANIFLHRSTTGTVVGKILDFGIAKAVGSVATGFTLTKAGTVVGSPAYMSPEQAAGRDDIDGRADVWSLGVVLFEALTGTLPHEAPNYNALMVRILTEDAEPVGKRKPDVPAVACEIVDQCLQRDRERRPDAAALGARLEAGVRELRAERFRGRGGRRATDQADANGLAPLGTTGAGPAATPVRPGRAQVLLAVALGVASGIVAGLLVVLAGYLLLRR
ncbi:MAG: serine/threonine protein kinase [Deltaproteobacteria bacterium]|nr:serine/threonine protein kinase [Deltaproteobacteria bacterium]